MDTRHWIALAVILIAVALAAREFIFTYHPLYPWTGYAALVYVVSLGGAVIIGLMLAIDLIRG